MNRYEIALNKKPIVKPQCENKSVVALKLGDEFITDIRHWSITRVGPGKNYFNIHIIVVQNVMELIQKHAFRVNQLGVTTDIFQYHTETFIIKEMHKAELSYSYNDEMYSNIVFFCTKKEQNINNLLN